MNIEQKYQEVIDQLREGKRPYFKFKTSEFALMRDSLEEALDKGDEKLVEKILCLLEVCSNQSPLFNELLFKTLETFQSKDMIIFSLGAIQKQIIDRSTKEGERPSSKLFECLRVLLSHKEPEVLEWALRIIEGLGPMSYSLKEEVLAAKPSVLGNLNSHKKASRQIVDVIIKNWRAYGFKV